MNKNKIIIFILMLVFVNCNKEKDIQLAIVNFNNTDNEIIQKTKSNLEKYFKIDTLTLINDNLPEIAYYKPRNRYRAGELIKYLRENYDAEKVIGITDKDISTTSGKHEDWGILGLAYTPGKSCVVSTFRIKRGIKSQEHFKERFEKVVLHEFGHTLGLPHCENSKTCLMRDANGKASTVDKVIDYCDKCKMKIKKYLK